MSGHLILGKDTANNKYVPISVDSAGHLDIDVQVADLDSKCMGSETGATDGTQHQLRVDNTGALHIVSENYDSVLIKGVDNGAPGVQRDCKQNANGDLRSALVGNTAKDGTGTNYYVVVDADGKLESTAGDATAANQTTQIANDATIIARIGTTNSTLGDTNSKIDAMRGTSDLGVINTSLGTVNTSIGTSNSTLTDIEAHQGNIENNLSSIQSTVSANKLQVDVITTALPTGAATQATLADVEAHQGNIENNLSSIQSTVSANKLQVDIVSSALPSGAATETTLAAAEVHLGNIDTQTSSIQSNVSTSSNQGTMITSLASLAGCVSGTELQVDIVAGGGGGGGDASAANQTTMITHLSEIEGAVETIETCVSGTELQVDVRNRTDSAPVALTFSGGGTTVAASGTTRTGTIDVGGCSSYVIMMNMLVATTNSSEFSNTDVSIEYSPDDGSTFMGTSSSGGGGLETTSPLPLYQASGTSGGTIVGYGVYIQSTASFSNPLMGVARTNKIRLAVQNPYAGTLILDSFAIYKFN